MDTLDFTQLAGKQVFHLTFFRKASEKKSTGPQQPTRADEVLPESKKQLS